MYSKQHVHQILSYLLDVIQEDVDQWITSSAAETLKSRVVSTPFFDGLGASEFGDIRDQLTMLNGHVITSVACDYS